MKKHTDLQTKDIYCYSLKKKKKCFFPAEKSYLDDESHNRLHFWVKKAASFDELIIFLHFHVIKL